MIRILLSCAGKNLDEYGHGRTRPGTQGEGVRAFAPAPFGGALVLAAARYHNAVIPSRAFDVARVGINYKF